MTIYNATPDDSLWQEKWQTMRIRLMRKSPFFGTLALYLALEEDDQLHHFQVDARSMFVNPAHILQLDEPTLEFQFLHALLHIALQHPQRMGNRDAQRWEVACDIVVNGIIATHNDTLKAQRKATFRLPPDMLRDTALEQLCVEEIYQLLVKQPQRCQACSKEGPGENCLRRGGQAESQTTPWRKALESVRQVQRHQGDDPLAAFLDVAEAVGPQIPWRELLWHYLTPSASDFCQWDRRFVWQESYLEYLEDQRVTVAICVDTSGSISTSELSAMLEEVQAIGRCYPDLTILLWYADAALYGPWELDTSSPNIPAPVGGGGTDFRPFFQRVTSLTCPPAVVLYMTDGYGKFPAQTPSLPTIWLVPPGGARPKQFPFGQVIQQLN
ncbi:hypothetical protein CHU32_15075 [Superficieibacter electus]|uniref:VWA-like domain-containing protein n=1 Tax=Superficieibacter electus TaxID=2022662 RepID=A0A2P5GNP7_9ENTR|nr:VWA-like domain-containing protein [Superficieibacter electus]POP43982.1 hypothetical protein CHU33_13385 [Superficieibacter electus]POP48154.1 hypothetical protein CHU32_15075 [Superficieibacter electus]